MQTPVEVAIDVFRGVRALARIVGVSPASIKSWQKPGVNRDGGLIPSAHHKTLIEAARERGLSLSEHDIVWGRE